MSKWSNREIQMLIDGIRRVDVVTAHSIAVATELTRPIRGINMKLYRLNQIVSGQVAFSEYNKIGGDAWNRLAKAASEWVSLPRNYVVKHPQYSTGESGGLSPIPMNEYPFLKTVFGDKYKLELKANMRYNKERYDVFKDGTKQNDLYVWKITDKSYHNGFYDGMFRITTKERKTDLCKEIKGGWFHYKHMCFCDIQEAEDMLRELL